MSSVLDRLQKSVSDIKTCKTSTRSKSVSKQHSCHEISSKKSACKTAKDEKSVPKKQSVSPTRPCQDRNLNNTNNSAPNKPPKFEVNRVSGVANNMSVARRSLSMPRKPSNHNEVCLPRNVSSMMLLDTVSFVRIKKLRENVEAAIKNRKTFVVHGNFPAIRTALRRRGWVEKMSSEHFTFASKYSSSGIGCLIARQSYSPLKGTKLALVRTIKERLYMSKLMKDRPADLVWTQNHWMTSTLQPHQQISMLSRIGFSTKTGLCSYLQNSHWFTQAGVSLVRFPRCYNVYMAEELEAFLDDYHLTACVSLLLWFVMKCESCGESGVSSSDGKVPCEVLGFALQRCEEYTTHALHKDLDSVVSPVTNEQWDEFIAWYYLLVHKNQLFEEREEKCFLTICTMARVVLLSMRPFWPQLDTDGVLNVWIMKPGCGTKGNGIRVVKKLEDIMDWLRSCNQSHSQYVVQKYIERPLLIYNTKFDIRQWFLVTSVYPLTIWMYQRSYLRFCSRQFTFDDLCPAIHLCNNAIQRLLVNGPRDSRLPEENMWPSDTFREYLKEIGEAGMWEKRIMPGMRQAIIAAMLASQEFMDGRKNSFEVFGADFMIDESFRPWLIEINACPNLQYTTSVTREMCAQCLNDVIKVIIDRPHNWSANTGNFRMIYQQPNFSHPSYAVGKLELKGKRIHPRRMFDKDIYRKITRPYTTELDLEEEPVTVEELPVILQSSNLEPISQSYCSNCPPKKAQSPAQAVDLIKKPKVNTTKKRTNSHRNIAIERNIMNNIRITTTLVFPFVVQMFTNIAKQRDAKIERQIDNQPCTSRSSAVISQMETLDKLDGTPFATESVCDVENTNVDDSLSSKTDSQTWAKNIFSQKELPPQFYPIKNVQKVIDFINWSYRKAGKEALEMEDIRLPVPTSDIGANNNSNQQDGSLRAQCKESESVDRSKNGVTVKKVQQQPASRSRNKYKPQKTAVQMYSVKHVQEVIDFISSKCKNDDKMVQSYPVRNVECNPRSRLHSSHARNIKQKPKLKIKKCQYTTAWKSLKSKQD